MSKTEHQGAVREALQTALAGIHATRRTVFNAAMELSEEFHRKRTEASGGEFSNLFLQVRERQEGRSIQIGWVVYHFRGKQRTGVTALPKPRSTNEFDLSTLKRYTPEWLQPIAVDAEQACRPLRDTLVRLTAAEREIRVCASRFGIDSASLVPEVAPTALAGGAAASNDDTYPDPFGAQEAP